MRQQFDIAARHVDPAFEHTAAHRRHRLIQHCRQRVLYTTCQVLRQLQITARGRIHNNPILLALHGDATDMRQGGALGIFNVLQQTTGSTQRLSSLLNAEAAQIAGTELQIKLLFRGFQLEFPHRTAAQATAGGNQRHGFKAFRIQQFRRICAL
ncbi:hypothetical protein SRABI106_04618 [Rahnella aquatilis]|nr:hypothetical protein SRABI106_04618 [Rahnella aquatilis]